MVTERSWDVTRNRRLLEEVPVGTVYHTSTHRGSGVKWIIFPSDTEMPWADNLTKDNFSIASPLFKGAVVMALWAVDVCWGFSGIWRLSFQGVLGCEVAQEFSPKLVSGVRAEWK